MEMSKKTREQQELDRLRKEADHRKIRQLMRQSMQFVLESQRRGRGYRREYGREYGRGYGREYEKDYGRHRGEYKHESHPCLYAIIVYGNSARGNPAHGNPVRLSPADLAHETLIAIVAISCSVHYLYVGDTTFTVVANTFAVTYKLMPYLKSIHCS